MAKTFQWLTSRNSFSEWKTPRQNSADAKVELFRQDVISSHPLPMDKDYTCTGFQSLAHIEPANSKIIGDPFAELMVLDFMAMEDLAPVCFEETTEILGLG